jgi:hypothetical protein
MATAKNNSNKTFINDNSSTFWNSPTRLLLLLTNALLALYKEQTQADSER